MRKLKKCLALLMVLCMVVTIVPLDAFATETVNDITETDVNVDENIIVEESSEDSEKIDEDVAEIVDEQESDNESATAAIIEDATESEDTETMEAVDETDDSEAVEDDIVTAEKEETEDEIKETEEKQISLEVNDIFVTKNIMANASATADSTEFHKILHLDCGRKYFTKEWIIALINEMEAAGYTQLQLAFGNDGLRFLLDDMSVTVNGKTYDSASVTAGVKAGNIEYYNAGNVNELTEDEMTEIVNHAKSKRIEIVPHMNMPGHMDAILDAIEYVGISDVHFTGYTKSARSLNLNNDAAIAFTHELLTKYVEYFDELGCGYFHIGADEYANDAYGDAMGFPSMGATLYTKFAKFVNDAADIVKDAGMIPRAWNDGISYTEYTDSFDKDIQITYWSSGWNGYSPAAASTLANNGHAMINTHGDYYYILGKDDIFTQGTLTSHDSGLYTVASGFSNTAFAGNETVSNPVGAMFCIWADYPKAETEQQVAANVRLVLRAMAARMDGESVDTIDTDVVSGGFNADGTIHEVVENTTDVVVDDENVAVTSVALNKGSVSSYKLNITDLQNVTATSNNEAVATATIDLQNKEISINAKNAGTATITVTTSSNSRAVSDGTTDEIVVTVSDRTVTPPAYGNVTSNGAMGTSYVMDTDGVDDGAKYVIVYQDGEAVKSGKAFGADFMAHDVGVDGDKVISGVDNDTMLWELNIIDGKDLLKNDGNYLGFSGGSGLFVEPTHQVIYTEIEQINKTYKIIDDEWNLYYNNGTFQDQHMESGLFTPLYFYKYTEGAGEAYVVSTSGLSDLINELEGLNGSDYTTASWSAFETALTNATNILDSVQNSYSTEADAEEKQTQVNTTATALYNAYVALALANVTITVNYIDVQSNVLKTYTYKYASGDSYSIIPESYITSGNKTYVPDNMTSLTGTVTSDLTLTVPCSEDATVPEDALTTDTLTVEYWITNARVYTEKGGQGVNEYVINKNDSDVQSATGINVVGKVSPIGYKDDNNEKVLVPWKVRVLDKNSDQQTGDNGVDRTQDGFVANYIRYYNGAWQYSEQGNIWTYITQNTQIVSYYVSKTNFATEVTVSMADWGYYDSQSVDYSFDACSLSVQVIYADGTKVPLNDENSNYPNASLITSNNLYTEVFGFWSPGRGIGTVLIEETGEYEVFKVTAEKGTLARTGNTNITGFTWNADETTVWEDENGGEDIILYNHASNPSTEGKDSSLMWSKANESILLRIYVKRVYHEDNLHVYYREGTPDSYADIYTYDIAVSDKFSPNTFETIGVTGSVTEGTLALTGNIIKDYEGKDRTIKYDISQMIEVADKYSSGYYTFTQMEKSTDNKSLYLYYNANIHEPTFAVDYGLPLVITAEALGIKNLTNISSVEMSGVTYGTLEVAADYKTATYTLTKMLEGREVITVTLHYEDGGTEPFTMVIIPATTVYYEDSFVKFNNSVTPNAKNNNGVWITDGTAILDKTQTLDEVGKTNRIYGYDVAYDNCTTFSMGSAQKVTVDSTTGKYGKGCPSAEFTFKGTGFDIVSLTDNNSGMIRVTVTNTETNTNATGKPFVVSNYYGQQDTLYQIPVVQVTELPFAKYHVLIETAYSSAFDKTGDSQWSFWMDAVRIYNPAGTIFNAEYTVDGEQEPDFVELRDILLNAGSLNTESATDGVVFVDGNATAGFNDYESVGPNNEVYLAEGQAIAFKLIATGDVTPTKIQIGAKLVSGTSADLYLNAVELATINSATDRNYELTNITWTEKASGQYESGTITMSNKTAGAIISLTNLKAPNTEFVLSNTPATTVEDGGMYMVSKARMMVMASSAVVDDAVETLENVEQSKGDKDVSSEMAKPSDVGKQDDSSNESKDETIQDNVNIPEVFPVTPSLDKESEKAENDLVADNVTDKDSNGGILAPDVERPEEDSSKEALPEDEEDSMSEKQETEENNEEESKTIIQVIVEFVMSIVKTIANAINSLVQNLFPKWF